MIYSAAAGNPKINGLAATFRSFLVYFVVYDGFTINTYRTGQESHLLYKYA
jgi:hypothetical protein